MTDDQEMMFSERLVASFERIATALEGLHETYRWQYKKQYPQRREVREAVVTRVQNEEDRIREAQGTDGRPIDRWLSEVEDEEEEGGFAGVRERAWLDAQKRQVSRQGGEEG
jgi:hypothetical protein